MTAASQFELNEPLVDTMAMKEFQQSKQAGIHSQFPQWIGEWSGTLRVWFEPSEPAETVAIRGSMRLLLDGRFVLHEYTTTFMGKPQQGIAIYGYHLDEQRYESAWVDSGHTGTAIMFSEGLSKQSELPSLLNVLGHYSAGAGNPPWGWRTELGLVEKNRLLISMYNVTPEGAESKAIEIDYVRE